MTAARHTREIIANTAHVIAIELYTAARALDLRLRQDPDLVLGKGTGKAYSMIRENVPYQAGDAWWSPEIDEVKNLILNERLTSFKPNKVDF
jgi:histidine ammonia-lyase